MGRLVVKHGSLMSVGDANYVAEFVMPADVRWTATMVCHNGGGSLQPDPAGNLAAELELHVNRVAVFEVHLSPGVTDYDALIIPWGDGLIFANGERVGWYMLDTTSTADFTACSFLGERI